MDNIARYYTRVRVRVTAVAIAVCSALSPGAAQGQPHEGEDRGGRAALAPPPEGELPPTLEEGAKGPSYLLIGGTSLAIAGVIGAWGYGAWWDEELVPFHFKDTGLFGRDTYAGGADKVGHMYTCYLSALLVTGLYERMGMSHEGAALLSAGAVTLVSTGIELTDGFTAYGFEYEDVVANVAGIGLGLASELSPRVAAIAGMRVGYVPSPDFLSREKTFLKFINDYTGMLFYLDVKAKGVFELLGHDPGLARYVVGGLVYGTHRYSPHEVKAERRRWLGVHAGLSLSELLRAQYPGDEGVESFATFFDYYAVPFLTVSVMNDLNTGEWALNFGVANRLQL